MMAVVPVSPADWPAMPRGLVPAAGYIDLCWCRTDLPPSGVDAMWSILSPEEKLRSDRLRDTNRRIESIIARGMLRQILGQLLGEPSAALQFGAGPHGKPFLLLGEQASGPVGFNLSHTAGVVLLAVASQRDVGVDIERIDPGLDWRSIARQFFSHGESGRFQFLDEETGRRAFYEHWVRKEALLKALGEGLAHGADAGIAEGFAVENLNVGEPLSAALAWNGGAVNIRRWNGSIG